MRIATASFGDGRRNMTGVGWAAAGVLAAAALAWQLVPAARAESGSIAGTTPAEASIFGVAEAGNLDALGRLLDGGASVNAQDSLGQTPLMVAILAKQDATAEYLIAHGADIGIRTAKGMTALHAAAYTGDVDLVAMLIDHGAAVNDQANIAGITPLHAAAEEDHLLAATKLVDAGADVSLTEVNGYTAGTRAGWREHWDVMKMLLASGDTCQSEAIDGAVLYEKCISQNF